MASTSPTPVDTPTQPAPANSPEVLVQTRHEMTLAGRRLSYQASVGSLTLREQGRSDEQDKAQDDKAQAQLFYIAYTLDGGAAEQRPLTFCFNGGPGSSSVWLHLGLLGPRRVSCDDMGRCGRPPYGLCDNEASLLGESDLVFIDPVGTGFSRMSPGEKSSEFHDYQRDQDAVAEFIRLYLSRHGRWGSPKFLIGESYGTTRAAGLARLLQERHDIDLNGLMLISTALDYQTLSFDHGNELPYALFLPGYTATAWYHQALAPALQRRPLREVVAEAERFALGDYWTALMQGSRLPAAERERVAAELARLTGLSLAFVQRCQLRIEDGRFFKELLRDRGLTVGRIDARFTGQDRDDAGEHAEDDPGMNNLTGAYAVGINRLLHEQLGYQSDTPYLVHAPLYKNWGWKGFENRYVAAGESLRRALQANPAMQVYVASGYYDLATPHAAGDYSLSHLGLREGLQANVRVSYFEAGHMMYIERAGRERMAGELREFVRQAAGKT